MSRFNFEIFLGIVLILLTSVIMIIYGLNEEDGMARAAEEQQAQAIEVGANLFETNCTGCHGAKGEGIPGLCPPLNDRNFFTNRLTEVGWSGSFVDYIVSTVSYPAAYFFITKYRPSRHPIWPNHCRPLTGWAKIFANYGTR